MSFLNCGCSLQMLTPAWPSISTWTVSFFNPIFSWQQDGGRISRRLGGALFPARDCGEGTSFIHQRKEGTAAQGPPTPTNAHSPRSSGAHASLLRPPQLSVTAAPDSRPFPSPSVETSGAARGSGKANATGSHVARDPAGNAPGPEPSARLPRFPPAPACGPQTVTTS